MYVVKYSLKIIAIFLNKEIECGCVDIGFIFIPVMKTFSMVLWSKRCYKTINWYVANQ